MRTWSPEDPFLYDVEVALGADRVTSYVGMRSFGVGTDERGVPRLLLNGAPYLPIGLLDQGYWPDGGYTAPADAALEYDIALAKRLGYNMLRKHIKIEPMRWYHHCDRIGMLVWQDAVNGGSEYHPVVITAPAVTPLVLDDRQHRRFRRADAAGRASFESELEIDDRAAAQRSEHRSLGAVQRGLGAVRRRSRRRRREGTRSDATRRPRQRMARPGGG